MFAFLRVLIIVAILMLPRQVLAITDPLAVPNNKLGIHILFPDEVGKAADLVNNGGEGEWGYLVIPIQNTDRDRDKWQHFFDKCKENKIIPIIRVATSATGPHWDIPTNYDLVDFSNFLGDLKWPIQNKYIIFLNEVNRADEFGGSLDPETYADFLNDAIDIFKSKSSDFFILPAGLDNSANDKKSSIKWSTFLARMHNKQPDIFNKIDGWVSHAYPNPDFSMRPDQKGENKINSFEYDLKLLNKFTKKNLPIFITEAGWSDKNLSEKQIGLYYQYAFEKVWNHPQIVTVAPFLLNAQDGPFVQFSFLNKENKMKSFAEVFKSFSVKGEPIFAIEVVTKEIPVATDESSIVISPQSQVLGIESQKGNVLKKLYNSFINIFSIFK